MKWFRFYTEAMNDPKILQLRPQLFRFWAFCLCIASESDPRGTLPCNEDIALRMKMKRSDVERFCNELVVAELIHVIRPGFSLIDHCLTSGEADVNQTLTRRCYVIHQWKSRQPSSDTSASRTKEWRERSSVRSKKVDVTSPTRHVKRHGDGLDTDTDTERELIPPYSPPRGTAHTRDGDDLRQLNEAIALLASDIRSHDLAVDLGRQHNTSANIQIPGWKWLRAARTIGESSVAESKRGSFAYLAAAARNLTEADREEKPPARRETPAERKRREFKEGIERMKERDRLANAEEAARGNG